MKRYKNITSYPIAIDCITYTKYVGSGEIVTLPMTRDVRYYSSKKSLVVVKDRKEKKPIPIASFRKPKKDPIIPLNGVNKDPIKEETFSTEAVVSKKKRGRKPKQAILEQKEEPIKTMETK